MPKKIERFFVKHYGDTPHPIIKGNGFDGLVIGDYREEAENFICWVNDLIDELNERRMEEKERRDP